MGWLVLMPAVGLLAAVGVVVVLGAVVHSVHRLMRNVPADVESEVQVRAFGVTVHRRVGARPGTSATPDHVSHPLLP